MENKHGLDSRILEDISRLFRQKCGFECVICGSVFYEYDHFDPEFNEAKHHDPNGIILLCPKDHAAKTRKRISKEIILTASRNPKCLEIGFSFGTLEFCTTNSNNQIGSTLFIEPSFISNSHSSKLN